MFLLKLSLRPWRSAPLSQVFSAISVSILLLLAGFLFWMERGLKPVVQRLQREQVITAYLDPTVTPKDESALVDTIKTNVGAKALSAVEVKMVGVSDFSETLKSQYPELARELESLGAEASTVIPRFVTIAGVFPGSTVESIKSIPGIEAAETSKDRYQQIVGAFSALRWMARAFVGALAIALLTGLIHLARMNSHLQQDSLAILRLWGAGPGAMRIPCLLSGLMVGLVGGGLAAGGWMSAGQWLALRVRELSPLLTDLALPAGSMIAWSLVGAGILMGVLSGLLGAETPSQ